jgi:putative heme-binding domain-containing protein
MLVAPGSPQRSVLLHRLSRRGRGQMPPLASSLVDARAVSLFHDWITELKPKRPFVREWQLDELLPALADLKNGRSLDAGKAAFRDTGCGECHRFNGEGGSVGPDLSGISRRLNAASLLESIVLPSKTIPEAYASTVLETKDGMLVTGRIEKEDETWIVLRPDLNSAESVSVRRQDIERRSLSQTSNMPAGIINVLARDEVLDLVAYLMSDVKAD